MSNANFEFKLSNVEKVKRILTNHDHSFVLICSVHILKQKKIKFKKHIKGKNKFMFRIFIPNYNIILSN